jgi:DNA polymerase-3 subunit gamma/tau
MSYQVLARKWRPQSFREVIGQAHVTETLANAIRSGRVAHAYIFSGVRGVGKTTTARILAKALNCVQGPTPEPCNQCDACREITSGSSLDVLEIDAASNRGIDQIRELREMVRYAPARGRSKIVILDEAHQLTEEASNALLKTLEEPPPCVVFILATTQPEDLADTIRSRAQHFHFRPLAFAEIDAELARIAQQESLQLEPAARAVIARAAQGSLRDALSLLEQAAAYCGTEIRDPQVRELLGVVSEEVLHELVEAVAAQSAQRALALVHRLIREGQNLQHFCREAIRHIRNLLVARVAGADSELIAAPAEERPALAAAASKFSEEDLTRLFQILLMTDDDLRRKPDPQLHLELGLLRMVNAARLAPLEELLAELGATARPAEAVRANAGAAGSAATARPAPRAAAPGFYSAATAPAREAATAAPPMPDVPRDPLPRNSTPTPVAVSPPSLVTRAAGVLSGLEEAQVAAIKAAMQQQRFLASLVEHVSRWELDSGEMRLYFPTERRALAEMLQARDTLERLRTITSRVLGQPLRVCVRLDAAPAGRSGGETSLTAAQLRARFEQDPIVQAMLERFGGRIAEVRPGPPSPARGKDEEEE